MSYEVEYPRQPGMWFMLDIAEIGDNEYLIFKNRYWHIWLDEKYLDFGEHLIRTDWNKWSSKQGPDFFNNEDAKFLLPMEFLI